LTVDQSYQSAFLIDLMGDAQRIRKGGGMGTQALDLKRSARIIWRYRALMGAAALLGLAGAVLYTALNPPLYTGTALVAFPSSVSIPTQAVVVTSTPVLSLALPRVPPGTSLDTLYDRVDAGQTAAGLMSVSARAAIPAQAIAMANAVARSYVGYVNSADNPVGQVPAQLFRPATTVTGTSLMRRLYDAVAPCVAGCVLIGAIIALALGRRDRRLRDRDEIADSIGVPVLASVRVHHPSRAADWAKLLDGSGPEAADAWHLHKALRRLEVVGADSGEYPGAGSSIAVLSLSCDHRALALGPALAGAAAALGIPTMLVVGPQQDTKTTAALHAACTAGPPTRGPRNLRVAVSDHPDAGQLPSDVLTVVVSVVDDRTPRVAGTMRTTTTVLGVSSGSVTAQQLARVTASAAGDGRQIPGILVADPDPADHTTGLLPQLARTGQDRMPTRMTAQ
jgi:capsular polysaccharide biosynthesis protein